MAKISEHIKSPNHKIHAYDQICKMICNFGSNKCEDKKNSIFQLNHPQNSLRMSIVDTPDKYVSKVDIKLDKIKIRTC